MKKLICVLLGVVLLCAVVSAQEPAAGDRASREQVVKLMDLLKCREQVNSLMDMTISQMLPAMHEKLKQKDPTVSDAELADLDKILADYLHELPFDSMFDAMIPAYEKNLTKAEVQAMIEFYSSEMGQNILAKMPAISADAMKSIQPIMVKAMDAMETDMQQKMNELMRKYHPEWVTPNSEKDTAKKPS